MISSTVLTVSLIGRDEALTRLFGPIKIKPIHFPTLALGPTPNQFLVCPNDYCAAPPHFVSPVFEISLGTLKQRWSEMLQSQPRIESIGVDKQAMQFEYIQRTRLIRFPDSITVQFIAVSKNQSTFAIYSRSHYGKSDLGKNEDRIRSWLALIEQL